MQVEQISGSNKNKTLKWSIKTTTPLNPLQMTAFVVPFDFIVKREKKIKQIPFWLLLQAFICTRLHVWKIIGLTNYKCLSQNNKKNACDPWLLWAIKSNSNENHKHYVMFTLKHECSRKKRYLIWQHFLKKFQWHILLWNWSGWSSCVKSISLCLFLSDEIIVSIKKQCQNSLSNINISE